MECARCVWMFFALSGSILFAQSDGKVMFQDGFETVVTREGVGYTQSEVFSPLHKMPGGRIQGPAVLAEGKKGKALEFHGRSSVEYDAAKGNLDLTGGEISFRVKLHFDPMEKNEKTRTVLSNQAFFTLWDGQGLGQSFCLYNSGTDNLRVCVRNAENNIVLLLNGRQAWKANEWHHVAVRWGKELEIWSDGEKLASAPFDGLFGAIPVDMEKTRITLGTLIGVTNIDSEFTMDELTIKSPSAGQISARPQISLPLVREEPALDGKLDEPFWQKTARVSGFVGFNKNELVENQPVVLAAYTAKGIYFGLEAVFADGRAPRAAFSTHDSTLYREDALEIFLQPVTGNIFYQFIGSAIGTRFDGKYNDRKVDITGYNPSWQIKTTGEQGKWTAEIFIPFDALETAMPAPGTVWKGNFCLDSVIGFSSASCWAFSNNDFLQPVRFGDLLFTGKERALRQEKFDGFQIGEPEISFTLVGEYPPIITVTGTITDAKGKNVYNNSMHIRDTKSIQFKLPILMTGLYNLAFSGVDETGQQVFYQSAGFQTSKAFDITLENYPFAGHLLIRADVRGVKGTVEKVVCAITGPDKQPAGTVTLTEFKAGRSEIRFPNEKLTPGVYQIDAQVYSPEGNVLDSAKQTVTIYEKPGWAKSTLGIDHSVPPPFEAVQASEQGLKVWGREFILGKTLFPRQIRSEQVDLLTRSPDFTLKIDGRSVNLAALDGRTESSFPDAVTLAGNQTIGSVNVKARTTVEFDGCLRYDLTLTPSQAAQVEELVLTLSLPNDLAKLLLVSQGSSSQTFEVNKSFGFKFAPFLWIGNDDRGLSWFAESDQYWTPRNNQMLQIVPGEKETAFKVNFITQPRTITKPVTITFGLMATPIRPIPKNDPFAYRKYMNRVMAPVTFPENLAYPLTSQTVCPEQGTLEFWVKRADADCDDKNTNIVTFVGGSSEFSAHLLTPAEPDTLAVVLGGERLLTAKVDIGTETFSHLAMTWNGDAVVCYCNGKLVGKTAADLAAGLRDALTAGKKGKVYFGMYKDTYNYGYTNLLLDDIRISRTVRYSGDSFAVPQAAFVKDQDTLLLDSLDETFKPDGQNAETQGGGVPSIGSTFVDGKFGSALRMKVAPRRKIMEVMKELGVNIVTHWAWTPEMASYFGEPYFYNPTVPGLKEQVAEFHRYGIPVVPYMAYPAITNTSGMIERYGNEWCLRPLSTTPWQLAGAPEGYYFLNCCLGAESYRNYFAEYTVWTMEQFGFDGFYSDGLAQVSPCQNLAHGCGYVDENGIVHSTWPVFKVRETLKRMYRIVKARNPKGWVINHVSFNLIAPTCSFSDMLYTGEQEDYTNLLTGRVRFASKPWGLYITTLGESDPQIDTFSLSAMTSLLVGTNLWDIGFHGLTDMVRKDVALRQAYEAFDTRSAEWIPYFQGENGYYQVADAKVKASLYYHAGKSILLLVANLNTAETKVDLKLNPAKFGLQGKHLKAVNTLTEQEIAMTADGTMTLTMKPRSFMLVKVE